MQIILVEDEQHCLDRLMELLEPEKIEGCNILSFNTVDSAIEGINKFSPDIVFMDVQLQDKTCFDLLKNLTFKSFHLIFTTAFEQYAVNAFKFSAMDYLLKPLNQKEFRNSLEKAKKQIEQRVLSAKMEVLFSNLSSASRPQRITVATMEGFVFLDINAIIRCQSEDNYTFIHTIDKQKIIASKTLKHFEELLSPHNFFRTHHSHLINMNYIMKYNKGKGGFVTLSDESIVEVSSRRKEDFLRKCRL